MDPSTASVLNTAIGAMPVIVSLIQALHKQRDPAAPPLTEADILSALQAAVVATVATDEAWKAAHPFTAATAAELGAPAGEIGS